MSTTITFEIEPNLKRRLKVKLAKQGVNLKDYFESKIKQDLKKSSSSPTTDHE